MEEWANGITGNTNRQFLQAYANADADVILEGSRSFLKLTLRSHANFQEIASVSFFWGGGRFNVCLQNWKKKSNANFWHKR